MLVGYLDILLGWVTTYACSTHFKLNVWFIKWICGSSLYIQYVILVIYIYIYIFIFRKDCKSREMDSSVKPTLSGWALIGLHPPGDQ